MIEPVLATVALLEDPVTGVNAQRLAVPLDADVLRPPAVTVVNSVHHAWVRRGVIDRRKADGVLLLVTGAGQTDSASTAEEDAGTPPRIDVALRLVCGDRAEEYATLGLWTGTLLRCCKRAIACRFDSGITAPIVRNQVRLYPPSFQYLDTAEEHGDDVIVGSLLVSWPLTDPWALGVDPA